MVNDLNLRGSVIIFHLYIQYYKFERNNFKIIIIYEKAIRTTLNTSSSTLTSIHHCNSNKFIKFHTCIHIGYEPKRFEACHRFSHSIYRKTSQERRNTRPSKIIQTRVIRTNTEIYYCITRHKV